MLSSYGNDGALWFALGISLATTAYGVSAGLGKLRMLTEIRNTASDKDGELIGHKANSSSALKINTLHTLTDSYSYDLRVAAMRIISERATKDKARRVLLADLSSTDPVIRNKAIKTMHVLLEDRSPVRSTVIQIQFNDFPAFNALINCLCHLLDEHIKESSDILSPICPKTRPPGEARALQLLANTLPGNVPVALEAGVISRWLYRYPFPCLRGKWSPVLNLYTLIRSPYWVDDAVMSSIVKVLARNPEAARQMRTYGLMAWGNVSDMDLVAINKSWRTWANDGKKQRAREDARGLQLDDDDVVMENTAEGEIPSSHHSRPSMENLDEQAVRRRRREAVVISDGDGPIQHSDIYSPAPAVGELNEEFGMN